MALRDSMRESAAPYLQPGEEIEEVVGGQTASQWLAVLGGLLILLVFLNLNRYRIIAVTNQRILVLDSGKMSQKKAKSLVTELPRSTRFGEGTGIWHAVQIGDEKLRIHRRFFKDMAAADAKLGVTYS